MKARAKPKRQKPSWTPTFFFALVGIATVAIATTMLLGKALLPRPVRMQPRVAPVDFDAGPPIAGDVSDGRYEHSGDALDAAGGGEAAWLADAIAEGAAPAQWATARPPVPAADGAPHAAPAVEARGRGDASAGEAHGGTRSSPPAGDAKRATRDVHVCFSTNEADLRPMGAAINSTLASAHDAGRLLFHVITTQEIAEEVGVKLRKYLSLQPGALQVHYDVKVQRHIEELVEFRSSSHARKTLKSPFNFAPFYLDEFVVSKAPKDGQPKRLIYLDTDVVVEGDISELQNMDLGGYPVAAVEDCSQIFDTYIDFKLIKDLGRDVSKFDPKACVFNRGAFVVDVPRWRELKITQDIEEWMRLYKDSGKDIYRFGMSQPPWLLALYRRYARLDSAWNCRGLGRPLLDSLGRKALQQALKVNSKDLRKAFRLVNVDNEHWRPFVASCSATAKLLHFNGEMKPWKSKSWKKDMHPPLCALPQRRLPQTNLRSSAVRDRFARCADRWWAFLSEAAAAGFAATTS